MPASARDIDPSSDEKPCDGGGSLPMPFLCAVLVLIAVAVGGLQYISIEDARYESEWREEQQALAEINRLLQMRIETKTEAVGPEWLRWITPADRSAIFERVVYVIANDDFAGKRDETDALIANLKRFTHLGRIMICGSSSPFHGDPSSGEFIIDYSKMKARFPKQEIHGIWSGG